MQDSAGISDSDLVVMAKRGDREAFDLLDTLHPVPDNGGVE